MQHPRGEYKGQWLRGMRQFFSVGVTVKYGEDSDENGGNPQRRPHGEGDHKPKDQRRKHHTDLDAGKRYAADAENSAESHHDWKCDGQQPDGRFPQTESPKCLRRPSPECDQCQKGVKKTALETDTYAVLGMRKRRERRRDENEKSASEP